MASRRYLVFDNGSSLPNGADSQAMAEAREVFDKIAGNQVGTFEVNAPETGKKSIYTGIWFEYKVPFSTSDLVGGKHDLRLRSESFLGREPTTSTCAEMICHTFSSGDMHGECGKETTVFDNGC